MYKNSFYNVFIDIPKGVIIYNTLWNTFVIVNLLVAKQLREGDPLEINNKNKQLFDLLIQKKIIIFQSVDEFLVAKSIFDRHKSNVGNLEIIVIPTMACNFHCWYCYENHNDTTMMKREDISSILAFINKHFQKNKCKRLVLKFFGGEPLLGINQVVLPLLQEVQNIRKKTNVEFSASITTNGFLLTPLKIEKLRNYGVDNFQITLDGNRDIHNTVRFTSLYKGSYDRIVSNIKTILRKKGRVHLRLNISEKTHLNVKELLDEFSSLTLEEKKLLFFDVQKVWQSNIEVLDTIHQIVNEIQEEGYNCTSCLTNNASIYSMCYADKSNSFTILPGGKLYKCTARDFLKEPSIGVLTSSGDVFFDDFYAERDNISPFGFQVCKQCNILPICLGGCSQVLLESKSREMCPLGMTTMDKINYAHRTLSNYLK